MTEPNAFLLPSDARGAFDALEKAVAERRGETQVLLAATRRIRQALDDALEGREIAEGSVLLERHKRIKHKLAHVDGHVINEDWDATARHLEDLRPTFDAFMREAAGLPEERARAERSLPSWLVNVGPVARKEMVVALQGTQGLVLFGLFLLTFGIGLDAVIDGGLPGAPASVETVWRYAHSLDLFAIPLGGILLGYGLVNEERQNGTIHFLAGKPVTRAGIIIGKWLGAAGALGVLLGLAAVIVGGVALGVSGTLGDAGIVVGYVASTYLLALTFLTLALAASTLLDRGAAALGAAFGAYALGLVWKNAFLVTQLRTGGAAPAAWKVLVYLANPFAAWFAWTEEMLGQRDDVTGLPLGEPWHATLVQMVRTGELETLPFYASAWWYVTMMIAWIGITLLGAVLVFRKRDVA